VDYEKILKNLIKIYAEQENLNIEINILERSQTNENRQKQSL